MTLVDKTVFAVVLLSDDSLFPVLKHQFIPIHSSIAYILVSENKDKCSFQSF